MNIQLLCRTLQARIMFAYANGATVVELAKLHSLSEHTINIILQSVVDQLNAHSIGHACAMISQRQSELDETRANYPDANRKSFE